MFVLGHLLRSLANLLHYLLQLAIVLFLVRAVLSWFQVDTRQPVIAFIYRMADPILDRLRRIIPPLGAVDLSPIIAIAICWFLDSFLVPSLKDLGYQFLK